MMKRGRWFLFVLTAVLVTLVGCKKIYDVDDYPSVDGMYLGSFTVIEDTCSNASFNDWTVLDVRVRNDDETSADLLLTDYAYFLREVEVASMSSGALHLHFEEDVWTTRVVTNASGMLDGAVVSLDFTVTLFPIGGDGIPADMEKCHASYNYVGRKRYLSRPPAD